MTPTAQPTSETLTSSSPTESTSSETAKTVSPKKRENKADKAMRYLREGRLTVTKVDGDIVRAECRGNGAVYNVGFENGHWICDCLSFSDCCHRIALQCVTVRSR